MIEYKMQKYQRLPNVGELSTIYYYCFNTSGRPLLIRKAHSLL
jgi:hypothetical protein